MIFSRFDGARTDLYFVNRTLPFWHEVLHRGRDHLVGFLVQRKYDVARHNFPHRDNAAGCVDARISAQTLILRAHPGQEFALGFGNAQLIEGALDVLGNIVPRFFLLFCGPDVVVDVVQVQFLQGRPPIGHRTLQEVIESLQTKVEHPFWLVFHVRDLLDHLMIQSFARFEGVIIVAVVKTVFILPNIFEEDFVAHRLLLK